MSTKAHVLHALQHTSVLSGAQLAKQLNLSRNAVWKAIQSLIKDGFTIESTPTGYQLHYQPQTLNATLIESAFLNDPVFVYDTIDSTNTQAKLHADTLSHRGVFVANAQSAGRGRYGRSFYSPLGSGLYISLLYPAKRIQQHLQLITPLVAVALHNAIQTQLGITVGIKWVNDLFLNDKKVAGILTEAIFSMEAGQVDKVIIGMGVNVTKPESVPDELQSIIGYLTNDTVDMNALAIEIVQNVFDLLDRLPDTSFMHTYKKQSIVLHQPITIHYPTHSLQGIAIDINDDGHLIVQTDTNDRLTLQHGEVSIRL
ncbi:biotin--[acetyl-CoA-carboxylase] ligase [Carnobacteriaceae bacterium zg-ZUI240]|nr:biotin--[acetyl-CoA-carboxylase] ligase [Carnobacteriaceae bacterium zg-ZUI240]